MVEDRLLVWKFKRGGTDALRAIYQKYGDAQTPIFWYQPSGSATYRAIYGDLSIKDVTPENLPK